MIVRIFSTGTSKGESPVNYLLSAKDHAGNARAVAPEVLAGKPRTTIAVINSIARKYRYVSGAIAFRDNEHPTRKQLHQVIQCFKDTMLPGLKPEQYNSLFVLHKDKGNTEVHFIVPMVELTTGRRLNIHPPGEENIRLYERFSQQMNHLLGYEQVQADPLKLALSDFERKTPAGQKDRADKLYLHKRLTRAIRAGHVRNRDHLCEFLHEQYGVEITRKGADYISLRFPGQQKAKRFRGPLYERGSDYRKLLLSSAGQPARLSSDQARVVQQELSELVERRRQFYAHAFKPKQMRQFKPRASLGDHNNKNQKKEKPMKKTPPLNITKAIESAMSVAHEVRQEKISANLAKPKVLNNITSIRNRATATNDEKHEHAAADAVHELENALGALQTDVNAAIADVSNARTPTDKSKAESRLARLMEQKRRLEILLAKAKVRQLNVTGKASRFKP